MIKVLCFLYRFSFRFSRRIIEKIILKKEGGQAFSPTIRVLYSKYYGLNIGYGTYGGCFIHDNFPPPCNISFGNYCSIGSNLRVFRANHPTNNFTSHPFLYNPIFGYVNHDLLERPALTIGNDVWIGSSVIILPRVKEIGDGSIIGAGSVVTKDVQPYTIIAGNPARIIRYRFNESQVAFLQKSRWWTKSFDELKKDAPDLEKEIQILASIS